MRCSISIMLVNTHRKKQRMGAVMPGPTQLEQVVDGCHSVETSNARRDMNSGARSADPELR